jgi:hypothetical protein
MMLGNRLGRSSGFDMHHGTLPITARASEITSHPLLLGPLRPLLGLHLAFMIEGSDRGVVTCMYMPPMAKTCNKGSEVIHWHQEERSCGG